MLRQRLYRYQFIRTDCRAFSAGCAFERSHSREPVFHAYGVVVTDGGAEGNGLVLDRKAMADLVFNNKEIKEEYDQLIHAEIIEEIDREIEELSKTDVKGILLDAPLLFEANINDRCDVVILITADMDERIGRVSLRDDADEEDIQDRINNQFSDDEKARSSDFIVDNSGEPEDMYRQLDDIIDYLGIEIE